MSREGAKPASPPQALRQRLFMLVASGLWPLAIAAVLVSVYLVRERQVQAQRSALELSRALATAVDAELQSAISVLESLGQSEELGTSALEPFHDLAQRIVRQRGWRTLLLADSKGQVVLNSSLPMGSPMAQSLLDPATMQQAIDTLVPVVGRVTAGRRASGNAFAVRVPVVRNGKLVNVLSAVLNTDQILDVLTRQQVPSSWVVTVLDQEGVRVARTRVSEQMKASASLRAMLESGAMEGSGVTLTVEGESMYTGYSKLKDSRWVVAVGVSTDEVLRGSLPLLISVVGGLLASLVLSAYLARMFARRVSEPIDALKEAAKAMGRGGRVHLPALGIAELDEVARALGGASAERQAALQERQRNEQEREQLLDRVTQALGQAQEAARGKDEFLAVLGHELRNPLAPITTALHLMDRKGDEHTRPEREIISRQLGYLVRLVDDLLDVSRITGKRLTMRMETLNLTELLARVIESLRPVLGGRSLQTHIDAQAATCWVRADEVRLVQVFNNLLGNALKFTSDTGHIEVDLRRIADQVQVQVRDDGLGMSPEVLEHAFEPFFQAPQSMDRSLGGLGLGLAIVKSLTEMHEGSVFANSAGKGKGTVVTLVLPCVQEPSAAPLPTAQLPRSGTGRVLVVDDNRDAADSLVQLLEMSGYQAKAAYTPAQAIAQVADFSPQVAMLDIGLPGMSGYDLAQLLRSPQHAYRGSLIALTGYGRQGDEQHALANGFDMHLTKPVQADALLAAVGDAVDKARYSS